MSAARSILCLTAVAGVAALRALALGPQTAQAGTTLNAAPSDRSARSITLPPPDDVITLDTSLAIRPLHTLRVPDQGDFDTTDAEPSEPDPLEHDSLGRADDADTSLLLFEPLPLTLPAFEPTRFSMKTPPLSPEHFTGAPDDITPFDQPGAASSLLFRFKRNTNLSDGGLTNATAARPPSENDAFADTSSGERFNRYSMNIEWVPTGASNQFQWLVVGGVQAIKADIGRLNDASLGLTQARGTVAIPTVGTGLRWAPADTFSISTLARTQTLEGDASMTNLILSADLMLSRMVGLSAGYEYFESDLTVESVQTQIDREGVFARITIRF